MNKKQSAKLFCGIRVKKDTKIKIESILNSANKKPLGRKIKVDELLQLAIGLVEKCHIEKLQNASLSNEDRKEQLRQIYIKKMGPISKDDFVGFMLSPEFLSFMNEHKSELYAS